MIEMYFPGCSLSSSPRELRLPDPSDNLLAAEFPLQLASSIPHVQLSFQPVGQHRARAPRVRESRNLLLRWHSTEHVRTVKLSTDEARILFDADKVDGLAAMGIARVFSLFGQMGFPPSDAIRWYRSKIEAALEYIQTDEGRRLVLLRLPYVQQFLSEMELEAGAGADIWES
jgi:uncharacterized protein